jgi:hypothetical protein
MNQYRCETCEHHIADKDHNDWCRSDPIPASVYIFLKRNGCASHSDFQNQREKVLDEFLNKKREPSTTEDDTDCPYHRCVLCEIKDELRAGEQ